MFLIKKKKNKAELQENKKQHGNNLPDKGFKVIVTKIPTELRKRMGEVSESLNKEIENIFLIQN